MFGERFCDHASQPAHDGVFFQGDHAPGLRRLGEEGGEIKRLEGVEVDDPAVDPVCSQDLGGFQRAAEHDAGRREQKFAGRLVDDGAADFEAVLGVRDDGVAALGDADVDGAVVFLRGEHRALHLLGVGGRDDRHVRDRAHDGDVLGRKMRRSEWGIDEPAARA